MNSIYGIINIELFYPFEFLKNLIYKVKIIYWNLKCRSNSNLIFTINEKTRDSWLYSANLQYCEIAAYDKLHFCCYCCWLTQLHLTLCDPLDCSTPDFPIHHHLLEFGQTHVHWVSDAIQPSRPQPSPSPPAFNRAQHQGLFQWVCSLYQVAKILELYPQNKSLQCIFSIDFL